MITCSGSRLHYAKSPSGSSGIVCSAVRSFSSRAASASDKDGSSVTPGAGSSGRTGKPSPVFADRTGIDVFLLGRSLFEVIMPPIGRKRCIGDHDGRPQAALCRGGIRFRSDDVRYESVRRARRRDQSRRHDRREKSKATRSAKSTQIGIKSSC